MRVSQSITHQRIEDLVEKKRHWIYKTLAEWRDLNATKVLRFSLRATATIGLAQVGVDARSGGPRILPCCICNAGFSFGLRHAAGSASALLSYMWRVVRSGSSAMRLRRLCSQRR